MADCGAELVRDRLPDLLHGRLSAAERLEVDRHLASCSECTRELALLEEVRRRSDEAQLVDAHAVAATVLARIGPAGRIAGGIGMPARGASDPRVFSRLGLRAAAALLLLAGGAYAATALGGRGAGAGAGEGERVGVAAGGSPSAAVAAFEVASAEISALVAPGTTESELEALARQIDAFDGLHFESPAPVGALVDTPEAW
jgi:anti-sigma factor RsiW